MTRFLLKAIGFTGLIIALIAVPFLSGAQPPPLPSPQEVGAPIDTDIVILLIITSMYAAIKLYHKKNILKKNNHD